MSTIMIKPNPLKVIIYIASAALTIPNATAADFSEKENSIVYTKAFVLLNNYQNLINQIGEESIRTGETPNHLINQFNYGVEKTIFQRTHSIVM